MSRKYTIKDQSQSLFNVEILEGITLKSNSQQDLSVQNNKMTSQLTETQGIMLQIP